MEFSSIAEVCLFCPNDKRRVNGCVGGAQLAPFLHPPSSPPLLPLLLLLQTIPLHSPQPNPHQHHHHHHPPNSSSLTSTPSPSPPLTFPPFLSTLPSHSHSKSLYIFLQATPSFMVFLNCDGETSRFHSNI